ncbi:MAG: hypothetical protein DRN68_03225 [Thaumarchaeota archaeon]|nr:MAG: hypothetical protein DRN68_03225 [Nitrososphaerota archaeon]
MFAQILIKWRFLFTLMLAYGSFNVHINDLQIRFFNYIHQKILRMTMAAVPEENDESPVD